MNNEEMINVQINEEIINEEMIKVKIKDIYKHFKKSDLYEKFDETDEESEIEIPKKCYTENLNIKNIEEFDEKIESINFWNPEYIFDNDTYYILIENMEEIRKKIDVKYCKCLKFLDDEFDKIYHLIVYEIRSRYSNIVNLYGRLIKYEMNEVFKNILNRLGISKNMHEINVYGVKEIENFKIVAAYCGNIEITNYIEELPFDYYLNNINKRMYAACGNNFDYIKYYDKKEKENYYLNYGNNRNIIIGAAKAGNLEIIKYVIERDNMTYTYDIFIDECFVINAINSGNIECGNYMYDNYRKKEKIINLMIEHEYSKLNDCTKKIILDNVNKICILDICKLLVNIDNRYEYEREGYAEYDEDGKNFVRFIMEQYNKKTNKEKIDDMIKKIEKYDRHNYYYINNLFKIEINDKKCEKEINLEEILEKEKLKIVNNKITGIRKIPKIIDLAMENTEKYNYVVNNIKIEIDNEYIEKMLVHKVKLERNEQVGQLTIEN